MPPAPPPTGSPPRLSDTARARLAEISVATLTTCLFKRGFFNQFIQDVRPVNPRAARMVGEAFTLRYMPAREDLDHIGVFEDPSHPQRKGIETCPPGHVFVIDSRKDARAASAGGILITRLMKRGCAGIVSDGGFRDTPELAELDFPVYQSRPAAPTNLTRHHAVDLNVPIGCGDAPVFPGDIIVGDGEGVVVLPAHLAEEIAAEAFEMTAYEDFVQEKVSAGASIVGLYPGGPAAKAEFAAWRKANGR
jgi:regulator of RNase E activity RraA